MISVSVDDGNVEITGAEGLRVIGRPRGPVNATRSLDAE
jgi:hypothetical protein